LEKEVEQLKANLTRIQMEQENTTRREGKLSAFYMIIENENVNLALNLADFF